MQWELFLDDALVRSTIRRVPKRRKSSEEDETTRNAQWKEMQRATLREQYDTAFVTCDLLT